MTEVTGTPYTNTGGLTEAKTEHRQATAGEKNAELQQRKSDLDKRFNLLKERYQYVYPTQTGKQPLISLAELARFSQDQTEAGGYSSNKWADIERKTLADMIFNSQLSVQEAEESYLETFSKNDRSGIGKYLLDKIKDEINNPKPRIGGNVPGGTFQFDTDPEWLEQWKTHFNKQQRGPEFLNRMTDRMGSVLENTRAFGRPVADFALRGAAASGLRLGAKELAKGIVSYSGLAGAVGGGLTGTVAVGAFVGAVAGAVVEYARQVNKNLNQRLAGLPEVDEMEMVGQKQAFLRKMEGLRYAEVWKPNDWRKLGKAAIFGGIAGAGAGALVEHIPELSEFVKERVGSLGSVASGAKDIAGEAWSKTGEVLGNAKDMAGNIPGVQGVGDIAGGAKEMAAKTWDTVSHPNLEHLPGVEGVKEIAGEAKDLAGNAPGVKGTEEIAGRAWSKTGETLGKTAEAAGQLPGVEGAREMAGAARDRAGTLPGVEGAKEVAGGAWEKATQTAADLKQAVVGLEEAKGVVQTPEGFVPQADLDQANQTIADLERQLAEAQQALGASEAAPVGDIAAGAATTEAAQQAIAQAQSALDSFGNSISLSAGSNPWEVSANILRQMGVDQPTPAQIMQLDKVICTENSISVPQWGIAGTVDARQLPVGFNISLTDAVKKTALDLASKK